MLIKLVVNNLIYDIWIKSPQRKDEEWIRVIKQHTHTRSGPMEMYVFIGKSWNWIATDAINKTGKIPKTSHKTKLKHLKVNERTAISGHILNMEDKHHLIKWSK